MPEWVELILYILPSLCSVFFGVVTFVRTGRVPRRTCDELNKDTTTDEPMSYKAFLRSYLQKAYELYLEDLKSANR